MKIRRTHLEGVCVIEPDIFRDDRGFFLESYQLKRFSESGIKHQFVQDNISYSVQNTLRGLHYQFPHEQAKLVQVLRGKIFDVAVDIRTGSPTFGQWFGEYLTDQNFRQMFIPEGFAHGFCVVSKEALFSYKCSDFYNPQTEGGVLWNDPDIAIQWPVNNPILSPKDKTNLKLKKVPSKRLPAFELK